MMTPRSAVAMYVMSCLRIHLIFILVQNVTKGAITSCVRQSKDGSVTMETIKKTTKAGTGCGGCIPLVTNIFKAEMKKAGHALSNHLCPHFPRPRRDVFDIVRVKKLKTFEEVLSAAGAGQGIGCEVCKPAVASILASLWNEPVMNPVHNQLQDTNDKFLANIQRNGKVLVVVISRH